MPRSRSADKRRSTTSKHGRTKSITRMNTKLNTYQQHLKSQAKLTRAVSARSVPTSSRRPTLQRGVSTRTNQTSYSRYSSANGKGYGRNIRLADRGKVIKRTRNGAIRTVNKGGKQANGPRKTVRFSLNHDRRTASTRKLNNKRSSSSHNKRSSMRSYDSKRSSGRYASSTDSDTDSTSSSGSTSLRSSRRGGRKKSPSSHSSSKHKHGRRYEGKNRLNYKKGHGHSRHHMSKAHENALAIQCFWRQKNAVERLVAREALQHLQLQWQACGKVAFDTERIEELKRKPAFQVRAKAGHHHKSSSKHKSHTSSSRHSSITSKATLKAASAAVSGKKKLQFNSDLLAIVTALPGTVGSVLESLGLNKYRKDFISERVYSVRAAAKLSSRELEKTIGIKKEEHRNKIKHALKKADEHEREEAHRHRHHKNKHAIPPKPTPEQVAVQKGSWTCKGCSRLCGEHIKGSPEDRCRTCGLHKPGTSTRKDMSPSDIVWSCEMCSTSHWGRNGKSECSVCNNKRPKVSASARFTAVSVRRPMAAQDVMKRFAGYSNAIMLPRAPCTLCGTKNSHKTERCQCCRRMLQGKDFRAPETVAKNARALTSKNKWKCNLCDKLNSMTRPKCSVCARGRFHKPYVRGQNGRGKGKEGTRSRIAGGLRALTRFGLHAPPAAPPRRRVGQENHTVTGNKLQHRRRSASPTNRYADTQQHHRNRKLAASANYGSSSYNNRTSMRSTASHQNGLMKTLSWLTGGGGGAGASSNANNRRGRARSR